MTTLQNKIIWLTGASSGIGEALTYQLAREGAKLILSARWADELNRVAANCNLPVENYLVLPLDLQRQDEFEAKTNEALARFGKIDVLINNGGVSQRALAKDTGTEVDRKLFEINFFGTMAFSKTVLREFLKQRSGMFVIVTSNVGKFGSPWRSSYSASKHALHGFFDSLRAEVHDDNIKVLRAMHLPEQGRSSALWIKLLRRDLPRRNARGRLLRQ